MTRKSKRYVPGVAFTSIDTYDLIHGLEIRSVEARAYIADTERDKFAPERFQREDMPVWLSPPPPPPAEGRQIKRLEPLPPEINPAGLKAHQSRKRQEHLAKIKAMGLTEQEYIRRQKAASTRRRRKRKAEKQ